MDRNKGSLLRWASRKENAVTVIFFHGQKNERWTAKKKYKQLPDNPTTDIILLNTH
jgi:hypothetical protein